MENQKQSETRQTQSPPSQTHDHPDSNPQISSPSPPLHPINVSHGPINTDRQFDNGRIDAGNVDRKPKPNLATQRKSKTQNQAKKYLLGFRVCGFIFSLISFSVMASDKNQGWALDSFHNYKEFRYCLSVNVIAFVYLGLQAFDLAYSLTTGNRITGNQLRCYLDFSVDQVLSYLLVSSSSSAAFRVDDWVSNWGKDKFPDMARTSMAFSFLGFISLALCSVISAYTSCSREFMS